MNCCSKNWTQNTYPQRSSVQCTLHKLSECPIFNTQNTFNSWHCCCELTSQKMTQQKNLLNYSCRIPSIFTGHQPGACAVRCGVQVRWPVAKYNMTRVWRNYVCMCIISTKLYLNISGICSTGEVGVDLLQMTLRVTASEKVKMKSCHSWLQLSHCIFSFDQLTICNYRYLCSIKLFEIDI